MPVLVVAVKSISTVMASKGKIIVTGGTGFIGSHTTVELIQSDYEVVLIDNLSNSTESVTDGIAKIVGFKPMLEVIDLCDLEATREVFKKHKDAVGLIHFAALKAVGESVQMPIKYYQNNLGSLCNVAEAMSENGIGNLIFSSSATVYGQPKYLPATESSPIQPANSPYGYTKQMGEVIVKDWTYAKEGQSAIALRYFNPIGCHPSSDIGELPTGVPSNLMPFITQTAAGLRDELKVFGKDYDTKDGTAIRDYIHVVDVARAHVSALDRLVENQMEEDYEVYNLGVGKGISVLEVIQSFEKTSGEKLKYAFADRREGDVEAVYASTQKANDVLGWKAKYDLDEMTKTAWAWEKKLRGLGG